MVLRLNSLFTIHILPENTGPHCNYKIIEGEAGAAPAPPPPSGDAMHKRYRKMSHKCLIEDDLHMSSQKMSCRCLIKRCLEDVLDNIPMFYI